MVASGRVEHRDMTNDAERLRVIEGQGDEGEEDALVGQVIDGRYRIESVLGEGGMGLVYRATHVALGKPLAIKVLRPDVSRDTKMIARFRQEAQSASNIGNEHIIDITDFGSLPDGSTYFAMEFLDGRDLTDLIEKEGPLAPERAVHIGKQICMALGAAHERGIVHRDLKPDNIFLVRRGRDQDFVKVLDFGIAKVGGQSSKLTQAGQVFGTPHYMSPEQCVGKGVDHRTDIYALGVILYEMLTARVPFDADNLMGILTQHLYEEPVPPSRLDPPVAVAPELERVVLRCLAKDVEQRYASMDEVLADLEQLVPAAGVSQVSGPLSSPGGSVSSQADVAFGQTAMALEELDLANRGGGSKRKRLLATLGVALLVGAGALAFFASSPERGVEADAKSSTHASSARGASGPGGAAVGAGAEEQKPAAGEGQAAEEGTSQQEEQGASDTPKVHLETVPTGAEVWMGEELLGNTPFQVSRPKEGEKLELVLRLPGYKDRRVRVSAITAEQVRVRLEKVPEGGGARRRRAHRARRRSGGAETKQAPSPEATAPAAAQKKPAPRHPRVGTSEIVDPWQQR